MTDKIASAGKLKNKEKEEDNQVNKIQKMYTPLEKREENVDKLRFFQTFYKNGIP